MLPPSRTHTYTPLSPHARTHNAASSQSKKLTVSVVVPIYNEADVLKLFYDRIKNLADTMTDFEWEFIMVNDGSLDGSQEMVENLQETDARIASLELSRNFGKEIAMTAGLDYARGDAVVVIDADLQDPPELIADFITVWQSGIDVVYARRRQRDGESWLKKTTARYFYQIMRKMTNINMPADTGDFRLMSRRAVDALLQLREHHRFMKGLFAWVGFPSRAVEYRRDPRAAGATKFNYWKLWNFAIEGITSFSILPLKIASYVGGLVSFLAFSAGLWIVVRTLIWGTPVAGYPSIMVTLLFFGGIQLVFIGVLGEYMGRIYGEVKRRPLYVVQQWRPANGHEILPEK